MKTKLTIVFLLLTSIIYCQELGRMTFMDSLNQKMIVREYKKEYMKFNSPINRYDTLYVGVMADSVSTELLNLSLFGYFPENINLKGMMVIIEYQDGSEDVFKLISVDETNYAVFGIMNDLKNIYIKTPKKIKFRNFVNYNIDVKHKNFFVDFFKKLD
jgi:hypothetical protein